MPTGNSSGNNQIFPLALVEGFLDFWTIIQKE